MKLELDTAQFGLTNNSNYKDIQSILDYAKAIGISSINTSPLYGHSEEILGQFNLNDFDVSTKTLKIDYSISRQENFESFRDSFYLSQKRLGFIELYSLIFSNANDILSEQGLTLWELASDFKDKEYIYKLGVRVTSPDELTEIIDMIDIDIVELPLSLINQSFVNLLSELKRKNIEVHTYSTFHQGILLKNRYQIPEYFRDIIHIIDTIPEPRMAYVLSFPKLIKEVDKIIIGCNKLYELEEIINWYNYETKNIDYKQFEITDKRFLYPEIFNKYCKYM